MKAIDTNDITKKERARRQDTVPREKILRRDEIFFALLPVTGTQKRVQ